MARISPSKKYVDAKEFVDYCKECHIDASLSFLERCEHVGFFSPLRRLILPDAYVTSVSSQPHSRSPFYVPYYKGGCDEWDELLVLLLNLTEFYRNPSFGCVGRAVEAGHPLDVAVRGNLPHVQIPEGRAFMPWKNYRVSVELNKGGTIRAETTKHFYSRWQVFILEALETLNSTTTNHVTGYTRGWGKSDEIRRSKLENYNPLFDAVADYQMKEQLILTANTDGFKGRFLEGERLDRITESTNKVAGEIYAQFSDEEWVEFLRIIIEMHVGYVEKEKATLSRESKKLIRSLAEMLMAAKAIGFEEIAALYDGQFKNHRSRCIEGGIIILPGELNRIFPDEVEQAIQHGYGLMKEYVREMNEHLTDPISNDVAEDLVNEIAETGYDLVLSHMHEVDHLWYHHRLHWESTSWAHTRSLVTSIEEIGKHWFGEQKLGSVLSKAFGPSYDRLRTELGPSITDAKSCNEYIEKMSSIMQRSEQAQHLELCGCHLVAVHLARNYLSHRIKTSDEAIRGAYIFLHQSIGYSLVSLFVKYREASERSCGSKQ